MLIFATLVLGAATGGVVLMAVLMLSRAVRLKVLPRLRRGV